jgi:acyl-homoserine lactone acylase PvdQ
MKMLTLILAATTLAAEASVAHPQDLARWQQTAQRVTIIRDDWGIAHVYGRTDADAVFGMIYAQAEDDFNRVEANYLNSLGRLAEAEGESRLWQDLRVRLFIDPDSMRLLYRRSPAWLKRLTDAWADGLNYYLHVHPDVQPRVITRFEPWMALSFSEGSIGWDLETVNLRGIQAFYGGGDSAPAGRDEEDPPLSEPTGSNGMAIAPQNTADGHALFLINPHTSHFFRSELQMVSEEGLNVYGAATWGQFFIYQGFNDRTGWINTSSGVDNIDEYLETVVQRGDRRLYRYGDRELPVTTDTITLRFRTATGMAERAFTVFRTRHGPVVRTQGDRWVTVRLMQDPMHALMQSFSRTKARDLRSFRRVLELHTNSSNNTVFASADGDIGYFHSNFIPRRDTAFTWTQPVDGSNPATDWHGLLSVDESPNVVNPPGGWLYNSNDAPWNAAGPASPKKADYPGYVERGGASARGRHAVRVLENSRGFTLDSLLAAAYDSYMPWFERTIPALALSWDQAAADDPLKTRLAEQVALLRGWDLRWSVTSVATSLAVFWADGLARRSAQAARTAQQPLDEYVADHATPAQLLGALAGATDSIAAGFGTWRTPWGDINRFQRLTGDIEQPFNDAAPSIPVGFTSGNWGSLASFGARAYPGTRKWYGANGNSFVAVVEFGDSVRARAVTAGGESGHAGTPHFNDQAERYAAGNLREVYFYRPQLQGHTEREYHPGN